MDVLQVWLLVGIPALVVAVGLLVGRTPLRAGLGFVVLAAGFVGVAAVDRASAVVFGALLALLYAAGRGGPIERQRGVDYRVSREA